MAYQRDLTQDINPVEASIAPIVQGKQAVYNAQVASAEADASMWDTLAKGGTAVFGMYQESVRQDIQQQARGLQKEFFTTNQAAAGAMDDLAKVRNPQQQGPAMPEAVADFKREVERLRQAGLGGMSKSTLLTRIAALTKDAISAYPGNADVVRNIVQAEIGINDNWANDQYIKDRFTPPSATSSEVSPAKMLAKDIEDMARLGLYGSRVELAELAATDPTEFSARQQKAREYYTAKAQTEAVSAQVLGNKNVSDQQAMIDAAVFPVVLTANFANNVFTEAGLRHEEVLKNTALMWAQGESNVDETAFKAHVDMHAAMVSAQLFKASELANQQLDIYFNNNPLVSSEQRGVMRKDVADRRARLQEQYTKDAPGSLVAMAGIMSMYKDKTVDQKTKLYTLAIQQQGAMANNPLVKAYWAGAESRKNMSVSHPSFYAIMVEQENTVTGLTQDINALMGTGNQMKTIADGAKEASRGTPTVPKEGVTPAETKAVIEVNTATAMRAITGNGIVQSDIPAIQSMFTTSMVTGANARMLKKDWKSINKELTSKLSVSELSDLRQEVSDTSVASVAELNRMKDEVNGKYGVKLEYTVDNVGNVLVYKPRPTVAKASDIRKSNAERLASSSDFDRAHAELTNLVQPMLDTLVYAQAAVMGETDTRGIGLSMLSGGYKGFYDSGRYNDPTKLATEGKIVNQTGTLTPTDMAIPTGKQSTAPIKGDMTLAEAFVEFKIPKAIQGKWASSSTAIGLDPVRLANIYAGLSDTEKKAFTAKLT